jgi:uncharacterized protein
MRIAFFSITILLALAGFATAQEVPSASQQKPGDDVAKFATIIHNSLEREWSDVFRRDRQTYRKPILVLYQNQTHAGCGAAIANGSFYCPTDQKIYLDTSFFQEIGTRLHDCEAGSTACRFSQAYVIAHQVGHHVQNLLGILPKIQQVQQNMDRAAADRLKVLAALQADCLAGIWAKRENDRLQRDGKPLLVEAGDIEAALRATSAVGDGML